ncbi:MAG: hypothetical protein K2F85_08695 [Helicobacter sp.]|nr:hypothetical protein [Helicobacter sp.]
MTWAKAAKDIPSYHHFVKAIIEDVRIAPAASGKGAGKILWNNFLAFCTGRKKNWDSSEWLANISSIATIYFPILGHKLVPSSFAFWKNDLLFLAAHLNSTHCTLQLQITSTKQDNNQNGN